MFEQEDDDGDGKFGGKCGEQRARDVRLTDVSQTRGNVAEDGDRRLGFTLANTVRDGGGEDYEQGGKGVSVTLAIPEQQRTSDSLMTKPCLKQLRKNAALLNLT